MQPEGSPHGGMVFAHLGISVFRSLDRSPEPVAGWKPGL